MAINSYNNALLTLLLSNQFVEIKGSVFKKFERENIFQLSCSDIVERFQLSLFLVIVGIRNYLELYPNAETYPFYTSAFWWEFLIPICLVYVSEIVVDCLKHAFIVKFNAIDPRVYDDCRRSLERDLVGLGYHRQQEPDTGMRKSNITTKDPQSKPKSSTPPVDFSASSSNSTSQNEVKIFVESAPRVAKRIGFVNLPLACLVIRVATQTMEMIGYIDVRGLKDRSYDVLGFLANFEWRNLTDLTWWVRTGLEVDYLMPVRWVQQPESWRWMHGRVEFYTRFLSFLFLMWLGYVRPFPLIYQTNLTSPASSLFIVKMTVSIILHRVARTHIGTKCEETDRLHKAFGPHEWGRHQAPLSTNMAKTTNLLERDKIDKVERFMMVKSRIV